jgi:hypothetical protein
MELPPAVPTTQALSGEAADTSRRSGEDMAGTLIRVQDAVQAVAADAAPTPLPPTQVTMTADTSTVLTRRREPLDKP